VVGVWPKSKSFSDEGFGPIPKQWRGICQTEDNFTTTGSFFLWLVLIFMRRKK